MPVVFNSPSRRLAVSRVFCLALCLLLGGMGATAQTIVGRISGTIKDASGAVIPGAEKLRLQLQADIFNAFNRTNFRDMDVNLADAAFGTLTAASSPRSIQLGLKFTF